MYTMGKTVFFISLGLVLYSSLSKVIWAKLFPFTSHLRGYSLKPRPSGRIVLMSSRRPDSLEDDAKRLNVLLSKAVELFSAIAKKPQKDGADSIVPLKLKFRARHSLTIDFPDEKAALLYLALPASRYSLLESPFIARKQLSGDSELKEASSLAEQFTLSIPLLPYSVALSFPLDATLSTDIVVTPQPEIGVIEMASGPLYFKPSPSSSSSFSPSSSSSASLSPDSQLELASGAIRPDLAADASADSDYDRYGKRSKTIVSENARGMPDQFKPQGKRVVEESIPAISLPNWLIWGGDQETDMDIEKNHSEDVQHNSEINGRIPEGINTNTTRKAESFRSAIQGRLEVRLTWRPPTSSLRQKFKSFMFPAPTPTPAPVEDFVGLSGFEQDKKRTETSAPTPPLRSQDEGRVSANSTDRISDSPSLLPVKSEVTLWVELNIPFKSTTSSLLNFGPLNFVLSQAGSLAATSIMKVVAPPFAAALVKDYNRRKDTENNFLRTNIHRENKMKE